jgi:hypothetical protein
MNKNPHRLDFELDPALDDALITGHAGIPLAIEMFRATGAGVLADEVLRRKKKLFGLTPSQMLEGMFALWASGGERCDDLEHFRKDIALSQLLGFVPPSAQTARDFFEKFHREGAPTIWKGDLSSIPEENSFLAGLGAVNRTIIEHVQTRSGQSVATIDMDAVILECDKRDARRTYEGSLGYQPVVAFWAEQELILADEYRDGNVPAGCGNLRVLKKALANLPAFVTEINLRMDRAGHENELMDYADEEGIRYAIGADMIRNLDKAAREVPEGDWILDEDQGETVRQCAEVAYVPDTGGYLGKKEVPRRRYIAIRLIKKQGHFFADGGDRKHFAVVTNRTESPLEIIRWQRMKAGTIEHVHHVVTSELAGGIVPSNKFGANAAWFRSNTILYNVLSAMRRLALPEEYRHARPKRLRFVLFNSVGRYVRHARETLLRMFEVLQQMVFDWTRLRIHHKPAT